MDNTINASFRNFAILIVLVLLLPSVFQEGIFMDGLIYSTISLNMANGLGSFWNPVFSETIMSSFHEHPPLAFILQSFYFKIFGDGFYVEKLYSFSTAILTAFFIVAIWKKIAPEKVKSFYWLAIIFWITVPKCFWSYSNNMLENTMGLFSLAATHTLLVAQKKPLNQKLLLLVLSSFLLLFSFLSKGFPGLFPLALFMLYWLVNSKNYQFKKMVMDSLLLVIIAAITTTTFFYFNDAAKENISLYLNSQVLESLNGERVVGPRWFIMKRLFDELLIAIAITLIIVFSKHKFAFKNLKQESDAFKFFLFFLLIGISATAPIMISPKQLSFYIVPAIPYFAIAFAMLASPILKNHITKINTNTIFFNSFRNQLYATIPALIITSFFIYGNIMRDKNMIEDVNVIGKHIADSQTISVSQTLNQNWSLMGYFRRKHSINLDRSGKLLNYMVTKKDEKLIQGYQLIELETKEFQLLVLSDTQNLEK